jgi:putative drug exporter of the RND superfamily
MALGEDYNILVMSRIREEAAHHPPREAVRRAMLASGGTITAAGLVLAGTFSVLAVVTTGQVRQIGAGLALGVLLDTFVVRTLLVPSTAVLLGRLNWWPSPLWRDQPAGERPGLTRSCGKTPE